MSKGNIKPEAIDRRMMRASKLLKQPYAVMRIKDDKTKTKFLVRSQSDAQVQYLVTYLGNKSEKQLQKWECTCYNFRQSVEYNLEYMCKHCIAVSLAVTLRKRMTVSDARDLLPEAEDG